MHRALGRGEPEVDFGGPDPARSRRGQRAVIGGANDDVRREARTIEGALEATGARDRSEQSDARALLQERCGERREVDVATVQRGATWCRVDGNDMIGVGKERLPRCAEIACGRYVASAPRSAGVNGKERERRALRREL